MVHRRVFRHFIIVAAALAVLLGCTTSEPASTDDEDQLARWLEAGSAEVAAEGGVPEVEPAPPRTVTLESLAVTPSARPVPTDLAAPDYFSFTLQEAAYVSVSAESAAGAAIALMDRSRGTFATAGRTGMGDGRIDSLLDAGEYRVRVQTISGNDQPVVSVHEFTPVDANTTLLANSAPGTLHRLTLNDLQQISFWMEVSPGNPMILEAMGRSLASVRLWKDGNRVTEFQPSVTEFSPQEGTPMGYVQVHSEMEPGSYLVTFYGGEARPWASGASGAPFYVRAGARYLGDVVDARTEISPMGRDAYLVSGELTVYEIENEDFVPVRVGISQFGPGQDRYRAISSAAVERNATSSRSRGSAWMTESVRWLFVAGTPGDTVRIRAIPERSSYEIDEPGPASRYLISTISTLDSDHALDASVMLVRDATENENEAVLQSLSVDVDDEPLVREVNLFEPAFFIVNLPRSGEWAIRHDGPEDPPMGIAMIPMRELATSGYPDFRTANPATFTLGSGDHLIMFNPARPGVLKFALYHRGSGAIADRRAEAALESAAQAPVSDVTYVTAPGELVAGVDHFVELNSRGGPRAALFVEQLPLDLQRPVPLTLRPGEELEIPVSLRSPVSISTGYAKVTVARNGRAVEEGGVLPAGSSRITVSHAGQSPLTFVLRAEPVLEPGYSAPVVAALHETLPVLEPGPALFEDYARGQTREFLLRVDRPGFYELQTTGRLSTRIATRTPANPSAASVAENGPGRNALVQGYFRTGVYLVSVSPTSQSAGRAGLLMAPLRMRDLGTIGEGLKHRTDMPAGTGLTASVLIDEAGRYSFETIGLYGGFTTRLEDADAWPVEDNFLVPGRYTYISWPLAVRNRRITSFTRLIDPPSYSNTETWPLEFNTTVRRVWNETPNRTPHRFALVSPARIPAVLAVGPRMEWEIHDEGGTLVADGTGRKEIELPPGASRLSVRSVEENNNVEYTISISTPALADGLVQRLNRVPAEIPVVAEQAGIYEFWSTGTWDVRAVLSFAASGEEGRGPVELARGDDRPGDWNFHISRYLPAGAYTLRVSESFAGSGTVEVRCRLRDEVRVELQDLPLGTSIELDQTIVGIPFETGRNEKMVRITADNPSVHLGLFRDSTRIAEGRSEIVVPIEAESEYLLRLRNESLNPQTVAVGLSAPELVTLEWDGQSALELPTGAAEVRNPGGLAVTGEGDIRARLSPALFAVAAVRERALANSGATLWAWNDSGETATVVPLRLEPGEVTVLDMGDDDIIAWMPSSPGTVTVLQARTVAGYLGAMITTPEGRASALDWSAADVEPASTVLGLQGTGLQLVRIWDGEPQPAGRRVELRPRVFTVGAELPLSEAGLVELAPGEAVAVGAADAAGARVLLSPDLVAVAVKGAETLGTVAARGGNRSASMPGGATIYLVNTGSRIRTARVSAEDAPGLPEVTGSEPLEAFPDETGLVRARVSPSAAADLSLSVWSTDPQEIMLLTDSGRRLTARPHPSAPYWSLPPLAGELRVRSGEGPVAAWLEQEGRDPLSWASRDTGRAAALLEGDNRMGDGARLWQFSLDGEAFVMAATDNRGITLLEPGGAQSDLPAQVTMGSGLTRRVLAVLGAGTHTIITRPVAGEPQPAPLRFQVLHPIGVTEGDPSPQVFLGAGERLVYEVNVASDSAIGLGLQAETDEFTTFLLDAQLGVVAAGRIYYRILEPGRYFLLVENGPRPMNARPVVIADQGSRTGIPDHVIESYRGN